MTMQPRISEPVNDTTVPAREVHLVRDEPVHVATTETEPRPTNLGKRIVSLVFGVIIALIGLRIVLLLVVANESNAIVDFIYAVTEPMVAPFRGILSLDTVTPGGGSVLDIAALVALVGWALIYALVMAIMRLGDRDRVNV